MLIFYGNYMKMKQSSRRREFLIRNKTHSTGWLSKLFDTTIYQMQPKTSYKMQYLDGNVLLKNNDPCATAFNNK